MPLSTAQLAIVKADIQANSDLNSQPTTNLGSQAIADMYNAASSQDVWRTDVSVNAIHDGIDYSKFTPQDAPDSTILCTNRLTSIRIKQENLQTLLLGRVTQDASKPNFRAAIRDAVTALPAGASGAAISAAGASGINALTPMLRKATRLENLFIGAVAITGPITTARLLGFEGQITSDEVQTARES
jgi:hypothetical protein